MKILIVGLGSMGKRRIRNLLKLNYTDIIGFDTREDRRNEVFRLYGIQTVSDIVKGIEKNPHIMIISTPPNLHLHYAIIALKNNIHFFMEINLLINDLKKIIKKSKTHSIIISPSSTMRFHPMVKKLKDLLNKKTIGKVLFVHHHAGQHLSDWHPWEHYTDFFVSKKETGGAKEIVMAELNWLMYVFPKIRSVYANIDKVSRLKANIDDIYQINMQFANNSFGTFIADVISIPSFKETKTGI